MYNTPIFFSIIALTIFLFLSLCSPSQSFQPLLTRSPTGGINSHSSTRSHMFNFNKPKTSNKPSAIKPFIPTVVVEKNYNVALGSLALAALLIAAKNYPVGVFFCLLGLFLTLQTGKIRFVFDSEALEVSVLKKNGEKAGIEKETLSETRENFAVGGKNRWRYDSITDWFFVPSSSFPVLMYFNEKETNKKEEKGQLHLFPVIMNAKQLNDVMTQRIRPSSKQ